MSLDGPYDPNNIFAKIARGEMLAAKVYEDDETLAFMDVFPQAPGHVLVIHKTAQARNMLEIDIAALQAVISTVQKVTRAVRAALNPDAVMVAQFNGSVSGQTIYHLHFHVIPRWEGQGLTPHGAGGMADRGELTALAAQITAEL